MDHSSHFDVLLNIFKDNFTSAYRGLSYRRKTKLLPYLGCFYRRWYYSALIENTILTPANLLPIFKPGDSIAVAPVLKKKNDIRTMKFKTLEYSLDNHPVAKDLELLISHCAPDIEFGNNDTFTDDTAEKLRAAFFIDDPFYLEYLTALAFRLNLLKKMPAIYSNRAQPSELCDEFFRAPGREIFDIIFQASVEMSAHHVLGALPLRGHKRFNNDFILSLLKKPMATDEIFSELYSCMGVNIQEFFNFSEENELNGELDDIYNAMMSGTFYLGVIIDKYFHTIFGYYLRLVNPGYVLPSNFYNELDYAVDTLQYAEDMSMGMFAPCSHYELTPMGLEYFGISETPAAAPKLKDIPLEIIVEMLTNGIKDENQTKVEDYILNDPGDRHILEIKVKSSSYKSYWKCVEFSQSTKLHDVYLFLAYEFGCDLNMNYAFFPSTDVNPFAAYTSPVNKRRSKKADTTTLRDFHLEEHSKFLMVFYDVVNPFAADVVPIKELVFEMELTKIKPYDSRKHYPYVTRISQAFRGFEFDEEWF